MTVHDRPTEEEIHRYVDGVADERTAALVGRWLEDEPADLRRVDDYLRLNEALHVAFARTPDGPARPGLDKVEQQLARKLAIRRLSWKLRFGRPGLAMLGGAAVIAGMAWFGSTLVWHMPPGYAHEAVEAHLLFVSDDEHPVEIPAERRAELTRWLSKRVGVPVPLPDLTEAGYYLLGGRLVTNHLKPAAQLMYARGDGHRITLFITRADGAQETLAELFEEQQVRFVCWQHGRASFALVGSEDPNLLRALSDRIMASARDTEQARS
jgi:anti-sigma factor RsiW